MNAGDLVEFNHPSMEHNHKIEKLLGLIVSDSVCLSEDGTKYKDVWWIEKDRVSPIKVEYLKVLSVAKTHAQLTIE